MGTDYLKSYTKRQMKQLIFLLLLLTASCATRAIVRSDGTATVGWNYSNKDLLILTIPDNWDFYTKSQRIYPRAYLGQDSIVMIYHMPVYLDPEKLFKDYITAQRLLEYYMSKIDDYNDAQMDSITSNENDRLYMMTASHIFNSSMFALALIKERTHCNFLALYTKNTELFNEYYNDYKELLKSYMTINK